MLDGSGGVAGLVRFRSRFNSVNANSNRVINQLAGLGVILATVNFYKIFWLAQFSSLFGYLKYVIYTIPTVYAYGKISIINYNGQKQYGFPRPQKEKSPQNPFIHRTLADGYFGGVRNLHIGLGYNRLQL